MYTAHFLKILIDFFNGMVFVFICLIIVCVGSVKLKLDPASGKKQENLFKRDIRSCNV